MASAAEYLPGMPPGIERWVQTIDSEYSLGTPSAQAEDELPQALAHVQAASPLGKWMREISAIIDQSTTEIITWNLLALCRLTEGQVQASSPFGRWMRKVSVNIIL